jgi:hypothetical protein
MRRLPHANEAQTWGLLRVLFLWFGQVSAGAGVAVLQQPHHDASLIGIAVQFSRLPPNLSIRIISFRKATNNEQASFFKQIQD